MTVAHYASGLMFSGFLLVAAVSDLRTRRIPNGLTASFASGGCVLLLLSQPHVDASAALLSCAVAFLAGMLMQSMRLMGGGDVKLFAASALWLGPRILDASLVTALVGGVLAIFYLRSSARTLQPLADATPRGVARLQLDDASDKGRVPYGVAIAFGCVWTWFDGGALIGRLS